mmetsp:Transcript_63794/g.201788  ORF Transcript_63794/g.201788 Transcript_63794/m.201788 type:complete len:217 (-) Transcript_63794:59-709(-)
MTSKSWRARSSLPSCPHSIMRAVHGCAVSTFTPSCDCRKSNASSASVVPPGPSPMALSRLPMAYEGSVHPPSTSPTERPASSCPAKRSTRAATWYRLGFAVTFLFFLPAHLRLAPSLGAPASFLGVSLGRAAAMGARPALPRQDAIPSPSPDRKELPKPAPENEEAILKAELCELLPRPRLAEATAPAGMPRSPRTCARDILQGRNDGSPRSGRGG